MRIILLRCQTRIIMVQVNSRMQISLEFQSNLSLIQLSPKYSSTSPSSLSSALWPSNGSPLTALGYASSVQIIFLDEPNHSLRMMVLQLVQLRIFSSIRPLYQDVRCEAVKWLCKAPRLTSSHSYFFLFCFTASLLNPRALTYFARLAS